MAFKYYMATVSWDLNQDIPTAKPEGFRWRSSKNIYMKLEGLPSQHFIQNVAKHRGVPAKGFQVDAISELPDDYVKDWTKLNVFTKEQPVDR